MKLFLVPNIDLPAICSPRFKPGPPSDEAQTLSNWLNDMIVSSVLPLLDPFPSLLTFVIVLGRCHRHRFAYVLEKQFGRYTSMSCVSTTMAMRLMQQSRPSWLR